MYFELDLTNAYTIAALTSCQLLPRGLNLSQVSLASCGHAVLVSQVSLASCGLALTGESCQLLPRGLALTGE